MTRIKISQSRGNSAAKPNHTELKASACRKHEGLLLRIDVSYYSPGIRRYRKARAAILARVPSAAGEHMVSNAVHDAVWSLDGVVPVEPDASQAA